MLLVTAYYPISKSKHSQESYNEWIKTFFKSVTCDIICFCPKEMEKVMNTFKTDKTSLVFRNFDSFDMMSDKQMKIWRDFNKIDEETYHSPELYAIWASKQEFVREAIKLRESDIYVWCDIGCFRNLRNGSFSSTKQYTKPGKITCLSINDTIGGGVLAGDKDAWDSFSKSYIEELSLRPHGKDQVIYKRILNNTNAVIIPARSFFGDAWFYLTSLFSFDCFDSIDKVVYINLKHREDRRNHIENELSIFPCEKVIRFDAIKEDNGAIGCTKSHIEVLKLAIHNKWKNVLIVEDDMLWNMFESGSNKIKELINIDYNVIVFGGANIIHNREKLIECQTTTAYLVNSNYYETLLKNFEDGLNLFIKTNIPSKYAIDQYWKQLQRKDKWYIILPNLCIQLEGYSDIEKRNVNYINMFNTFPQKRILDRILGRR